MALDGHACHGFGCGCDNRLDGLVQAEVERRVREEAAHLDAAFEADLRAAADRYLLSLHTGFWSRGFDIHHPDGRARAVDHIVETFKGIAKELVDL